MTPLSPLTAALEGSAARYGAASRYDFDNPDKWITTPDVPVLDEHEMTGEDGKPVAYVGRQELEQIAANNNRRVYETGDPAPLILGHTSDDPRAPEKPVVGYAVNYRVQPFNRNPDGTTKYAIFTDYKIRRDKANVINDFPRRSVELWWNKREIDPIALLGGTTPERDLGVVIRNARLKAVALLGGSTPERDLGMTVRYDRRGDTVLRYAMAMEDCEMSSHRGSGFKQAKKMSDPGDPFRMAEGEPFPGEEDDLENDLDGGDDSMPEDDLGGDPDGPPDDEDPVVAKVLASKQFQDLASKVNEIYDLIAGGDETGDAGLGDEEGGMPPPPAPGACATGMGACATGMGAMPPGMDAGMGDGMGGDPSLMPPEEEARGLHGDKPVQFEMGGAFAGPGNATIPTFGGGTKGNRYSRTAGTPAMHTNGTGRTPPAASDAVVRLQRQVDSLTAQLARADAEKLVNQLEGEGIVFDDKDAHVQTLARMGAVDRNTYADKVIRKNYQRRQSNPAAPGLPGLARYAANGAAAGLNGQPGEYEPAPGSEAVLFAEALIASDGDQPKAIKMMRDRQQRMANGPR